jgi:hypothetical protein
MTGSCGQKQSPLTGKRLQTVLFSKLTMTTCKETLKLAKKKAPPLAGPFST